MWGCELPTMFSTMRRKPVCSRKEWNQSKDKRGTECSPTTNPNGTFVGIGNKHSFLTCRKTIVLNTEIHGDYAYEWQALMFRVVQCTLWATELCSPNAKSWELWESRSTSQGLGAALIPVVLPLSCDSLNYNYDNCPSLLFCLSWLEFSFEP